MPYECTIPRHVTGLYMFTVINLICLFHISIVSCDVEVVRSVNNDTVNSFSDFEANFGPGVPEEGIKGYLTLVRPRNASNCDGDYIPHAPNESAKASNMVWIALMKRNGCKFDYLVHTAKLLQYQAVIVYNNHEDDTLIHMGGQLVDTVPSVFIRWTDGELLRKNFLYEKVQSLYYVQIERNDSNPYRPYMLWPFAVVVGTCFFIMLLFMIFKWIRDVRKKRKSRLSTKHLKKIPVKKFKKGDSYDVCAICLDDFEQGDKLRILPCSHAYHCKCIDPWLTKRKKTCPVCKRKVIPGSNPDSESDSGDESEVDSNTERTPLLAGNNNNQVMDTPRRSTFDNSGLPEALRTQQQVSVIQVVEHASESDDSSDESVNDSAMQEGLLPSGTDSHTERSEGGAVNIGYYENDEKKEEERDETRVVVNLKQTNELQDINQVV